MFFDRILAKKSQKGADGIIMKRKIPPNFVSEIKKKLLLSAKRF